MQLRPEQLEVHLGRETRALYTVYGDPLLALEAGDVLRQHARRSGFDEREVMVALPGFDWQQLAASAANLSLFGGRKLIDLRIPSGKPGLDGAKALVDYADRAGAAATDTLLMVSLPALTWQDEKAAWLKKLDAAGVVVKATAPSLAELPGWIGMRLDRQQQSAGREALRFIAERVEGNLLAAHQEISKLGLLYPPGELALEQVRAAVLDVARFDVDGLREALLSGDLRRYARTLDGLRQEGEAPPLILWGIAEEVRTLLQGRHLMAAGQSADAAVKALRVWGSRQGPFRRALARVDAARLERALAGTALADRISKGVTRGDVWSELLKVGMLLK